MPRKSKEQEKKDKATARTRRWGEKNLKKYLFALNVSTNERDKRIAEWLEAQPNKSEAIKSALYDKMTK